MTAERETRERELAAWYDGGVDRRVERGIPERRAADRDRFAAQLVAEGRRRVQEIGCGPDVDGAAFAAGGLAWSGVDLAPAGVEFCREHGLDAHVAPVHKMPIADDTFAAGWAMSVLMHVAEVDIDEALAELVRLQEPGAPLAIGTWGAASTSEGPVRIEGQEARFFSLRADDRWRAVLQRHGAVEQWATWPDPRSDWHHQWAVLRV